jgi:transcriptional regulator
MSEGVDGVLTVLGYMSRANPQWKSFGGQEVLLIFQGAHTYISPRWYDHVNVPTWNYMMVHLYGKVRLVEGMSCILC